MSKQGVKSSRGGRAKVEEKVESGVLKEIFNLGLGTVFLTEKMIRNRVSKISLPKDAMNFVADQSKKSREQLSRILSNEISKFFERINVSEELNKILSRYKYKISVEVEVMEKDEE